MSLIIKNLSKNFKDHKVLKNISLELKKGEIILNDYKNKLKRPLDIIFNEVVN